MKILILTADNNRHLYFASRLINNFTNDHLSLLIDPKKNPNIISKNKYIRVINNFLKSKSKIHFIKRYFLNFFYKKYLIAIDIEKNEAENKYFQELSDAELSKLNSCILGKVSATENINDHKYENKIKEFNPDIIVVMGSSLLKENIFQIPKFGVINMHTGLSPYYRGGRSNFWPFIFNDIGGCGVTIHLLDKGIDSGDIISHGIPDIDMNDTYSSINCKSIKLGTELMIQAVDSLKAQNLKSVKQWTAGDCRIFFNSDYNGYYAYKYVKNCQEIVNSFLLRKKYPKKLFLNGNEYSK